jgi:predicted hotdog family 3-hydroxylacyl-ACP dehydratase
MSHDLATLLPHKHPMLLLDRLIASGKDGIAVEVTIRKEYPFTGHTIGSWIGLEFMAQAAGVLAALNSSASVEEPQIGFLLGTRRYTAHAPEFSPGQKLKIEVTLEPSNGSQMMSAKGVIADEAGKLLCEASLTLYQPGDDAIYLNNE